MADFGQFVAGLNHGVLDFIQTHDRDPGDDELRALGERVLAEIRAEELGAADAQTYTSEL